MVEAEFEGRARGNEFHEFVNGIDPHMTKDQKITVWKRQMDMAQAKVLYEKVKDITMYPPNADMQVKVYLWFICIHLFSDLSHIPHSSFNSELEVRTCRNQ